MTLALPDRLPALAKGKQEPGSGMVCAEQAVNWLVSGRLDLGDETDHPSCVQPVLNALSIKVNDLLPDDRRGEMWPLILAQPGTARPDMEPGLSANLATWCVRTAADYVADLPRRRRRRSFTTATALYAKATVIAVTYAAAVVYAADAVAAGGGGARAADALLTLLAGCQAEHARLTGHQPTPVETARVERLATLVGARPQSA